MKELVKVQETLDQVLDYLAGNDIGLVVENLRNNIDTSKNIVENLLIQRVVRPNLTDKHPIEAVNETMQNNTNHNEKQLVCDNHKYIAIYDGYEIGYLECLKCGKAKAY